MYFVHQSPSIECYVFVIALCGVLCTRECFNGLLCVHNSPMHVCLMYLNSQVHDILCTQRNLFVHPFCINFMTNELLLLLVATNVG